jgi:hypothetical protein
MLPWRGQVPRDLVMPAFVLDDEIVVSLGRKVESPASVSITLNDASIGFLFASHCSSIMRNRRKNSNVSEFACKCDTFNYGDRSHERGIRFEFEVLLGTWQKVQ